MPHGIAMKAHATPSSWERCVGRLPCGVVDTALSYPRCRASGLFHEAKPNKDNADSKRPTSLMNLDEDILNKT